MPEYRQIVGWVGGVLKGFTLKNINTLKQKFISETSLTSVTWGTLPYPKLGAPPNLPWKPLGYLTNTTLRYHRVPNYNNLGLNNSLDRY